VVSREVGGVIVAFGVIVIIIGLITWAGGLSWFGRLPGDIRIEREHSRVYIPITSMILVSVILTIAMHLLRKLF
jgi:hypothetical protein